MKLFYAVFLIGILTIVCSSGSSAQDRGFGAGILLGDPTGLSFKGWVNPTNAIDAGVAWSYRASGSFDLHVDYLWHSFHVFDTQEELPLYYGIGGRVRAANHEDSHVGVRVVVGLDYMFRNAPVDIFFEIAPVVDLAPATDVEGNIGLGARFWFH